MPKHTNPTNMRPLFQADLESGRLIRQVVDSPHGTVADSRTDGQTRPASSEGEGVSGRST
jgi:hypothetical protein